MTTKLRAKLCFMYFFVSLPFLVRTLFSYFLKYILGDNVKKMPCCKTPKHKIKRNLQY